MSSVLLVDNYDSFTFNLQHLLAAELGELPTVCHNDEIPFDALRRGEFAALVISPGPGRPERAADFGGCARAILEFDLPVLGVCLGHQGIATAFGGAVEQAPAPVHGEATEIAHQGAPMFAGLPLRFEAVRYHSWVVAEPLPDCLEVTARAGDGTVMALAHRTRPIWGVQFHPESIGTPSGAALVRNFVAATGRARAAPRRRDATPPPASPAPTWDVVVRKLSSDHDPEAAFEALFAGEANAFWLDDAAGAGRTFIGTSTGPASELLTQRPGEDRVRVVDEDGSSSAVDGSIFDLLRDRLRERRVECDLPFDFCGGYVGYFGYGLKRGLGSPNRFEAKEPDACFMAATRMVAFDERAGETLVIGVVPPGAPRDVVVAEVDALSRRLEQVPPLLPASPPSPPSPPDRSRPDADPEAGAAGDEVAPGDADAVDLALDRPEYLDAIAAAQRALYEGESYELCLTNRLRLPVGTADPLQVFARQRRLNPAPYGAFLRFGDLAVLSSSPERFLRISPSGEVEARPVKGTRARGATPAEDERLREELRTSVKDRAENLMIVDLLRNDLSRTCEVGSVVVDELIGLETHPHVHQLVSTIRGTLREDRDPIGCVEACFPGGSMTGAPKLRSMEILDRLEPEPRGIYSGALGYLGLGGGVDLSIVIRTAVLRDGVATVGSGGAITVRSDPEEEWREMLLKAAPVLDALR
ncbi:MAG: pabB [Solirubrobacterales bacterium]|nr:pabB [Solirubrobacterales bacterium]